MITLIANLIRALGRAMAGLISVSSEPEPGHPYYLD